MRYDKYDPFSGGFRAMLAADFAPGTANASDPLNPANFNKALCVGLNNVGAVVLGAGATGVLGVMIISDKKYAGDVVDIMTHGEIVEMTDGKYSGVVAGQNWYAPVASADGLLVNTAPAAGAAGFYVGTTVEPDRLVVRCQKIAVPAGP